MKLVSMVTQPKVMVTQGHSFVVGKGGGLTHSIALFRRIYLVIGQISHGRFCKGHIPAHKTWEVL